LLYLSKIERCIFSYFIKHKFLGQVHPAIDVVFKNYDISLRFYCKNL